MIAPVIPLYTISDTGNHTPDPKHLIVFQVENMLKPVSKPPVNSSKPDEIDVLFPVISEQTGAGPEQLVHRELTCNCTAHIAAHRIGTGNCKRRPNSTIDELLALTLIPGYADAAIEVLQAWTERITELALCATGIKAYHQYAPALRWIVLHIPVADNFGAQLALNELYLAQSVTEPSEWWLDQYTREIDPEASDELDFNRRAQKFLADEKVSIETGTFHIDGVEMTVDAIKDFRADPILEAYRAIYPEVQAREMARLASNAMHSSLGDEEIFQDFEGDDDRGFVPPPLEQSFNPDMQMIDWSVVDFFRDFKRECWNKAAHAFPETENERRLRDKSKGGRFYKKNGKTFEAGLYSWDKEVRNARFAEFKRLWFISRYEPVSDDFEYRNGTVHIVRFELVETTPPSIKSTMEHFTEIGNMISVRREFLDYVKELAQKGDDPVNGSCLQAAAVMVYPFLTDSANEGVLISEEELSPDLLECISLYEEEIVQRSDRMSKGDGENAEMVDRDSKIFFHELVFVTDFYCEPMSSYDYVKSYIAALSSGASEADATATAWSTWRTKMSWKGSKQYDAIMLLDGKKQDAWKAFWAQCPKHVYRPKSKIVSANQAGLKIAPATLTFKPLKPLMFEGEPIAPPVGNDVKPEPMEIREIGWGIAVNKMREGEFALDNREAILGLKDKGWREADYFLKLVAATL